MSNTSMSVSGRIIQYRIIPFLSSYLLLSVLCPMLPVISFPLPELFLIPSGPGIPYLKHMNHTRKNFINMQTHLSNIFSSKIFWISLFVFNIATFLTFQAFSWLNLCLFSSWICSFNLCCFCSSFCWSSANSDSTLLSTSSFSP